MRIVNVLDGTADSIVKMYIDGKGSNEISELVGFTTCVVLRELRKRKICVRGKGWSSIFKRGFIGEKNKYIIVDMYKSGVSMMNISKKMSDSGLRISKSGVRDVLVRNNVELREKKKPRCISDDKIQEAMDLYNSGMTYRQLGEKYNASGTSICDLLRSRGLKSRPESWARIKGEDDKKEIREAYQRGVSKSYLAMKFDCSGDAIAKVLRDAGIPIRSFDEAVGIEFFDVKERKFFLKSTWEVKLARWLDEHDFEWDYEVEKFKLYYGMGYTPDFWIYKDGKLDKLIDVKGWLRPRSQKRIKMFKHKYKNMRLFIFGERHLRKMKLI